MPKRPLKVFLYYTKNDLPIVEALQERLELDDVDVRLPEIADEIEITEKEDELHWQARREEIQTAVDEVDIVLFCLSNQFDRFASLNKEWQFVLDHAAKKRQGSLSILPVRLEECAVPATMKRWLSVNLHEMDGYEKLMYAMKLRADKVGAELIPNESWKESFYETVPVSASVDSQNGISTKTIAFLGIAGIVALVLIVVAVTRSANNTQINADTLAENATQNVLSAATNQAGTITAEAFIAGVPLTQTAVYQTTTEPLSLTSTALNARITPTITATPVALPTQIIVSDNISMMLVPGGRYVIGYDGDPNAAPANLTSLNPYYIDQFEVTNAQYQTCVLAGVCQPPKESGSQTHPQYFDNTIYAAFPVINVDWEMARTFCEWRGARLPTEAEWETAARGYDALVQPWGEGTGCLYANHDNCIGDTQAVDKYLISESEFGVYNMAGNVSEWVSSLYVPYPYDPFDDRDNPASSGPRVVRGGSWTSSPEEILAYHRISLDPSAISVYENDLGFRCASDVNQ